MRGSNRRGKQSAESQPFSSAKRDRIASLLALLTVGALVLTFWLSGGTQFLIPGPLASAHGAIEKCSACHTASGTGKMIWLHGVFSGDPRADSRAPTCHKMPNRPSMLIAHREGAGNQHQALRKVARRSRPRRKRRGAEHRFPADKVMAGGDVYAPHAIRTSGRRLQAERKFECAVPICHV